MMPKITAKMELETWAKDKFFKETKDTFGFSLQDVDQILQNYFDLPKNGQQQVAYLEGFLGLEKSLQFVEEIEKKKSEKSPSAKLSGVWKANSMNVVQLIGNQLGMSEEESEQFITHLKNIESELERREYLENLIGKGFEAERILILLAKMIKKEQDDSIMLAKKKEGTAQSASKKKKNQTPSKNLEKIGDKPWCECLATAHELLRNCLHCGKIICAFEGDDVCPFCQKLPAHVEWDTLSGLDASVERTKTLLDYQQNSAARTHVHDNAADFDMGADQYNKWISAEERANALRSLQEKAKMEEEAKSRRVITIDLENNRVLVEKPPPVVSVKHVSTPPAAMPHDSSEVFRNPNLKNRKAVFIPSTQIKPKVVVERDWVSTRLQDEDIY